MATVGIIVAWLLGYWINSQIAGLAWPRKKGSENDVNR